MPLPSRKIPKKSDRAPKIKKVEILQSLLIKPPTATTKTLTKRPPPLETKNAPPTPKMDSASLPVVNNGGPLLDEEVITIYSDNSTIATGNLGDSLELDLLLAQLEGDPAASFMFEPARIIPTPILSQPMRSPTPPQPPLPPAPVFPPPQAERPVMQAGQKRPRCHDNASPSTSSGKIKKGGKNLADIMEMVGSDLEESYRADKPKASQHEGIMQPKTPRELTLTTYSS
ncbi:myb-related transcription factor, partner of profilin-like [Photinus pyralis]|uniref:myb-related transcription factor, partner of profilin-like n=2 Tax=Photinus pyralis TaxID=7054 RepID=UPI0012678258|nr:myb-related transcription factor, partner of profilin-like [Photinus pyralis]